MVILVEMDLDQQVQGQVKTLNQVMLLTVVVLD
jgi:hypothetical protein